MDQKRSSVEPVLLLRQQVLLLLRQQMPVLLLRAEVSEMLLLDFHRVPIGPAQSMRRLEVEA